MRAGIDQNMVITKFQPGVEIHIETSHFLYRNIKEVGLPGFAKLNSEC